MVDLIIKIKEGIEKKDIIDLEVVPTFGGYANPSFEAQVETVSKAAASNIMSIDAQVEELWGDTRDNDWKQKEITRIKEEKGIVSMEEPSINLELLENNEMLNK